MVYDLSPFFACLSGFCLGVVVGIEYMQSINKKESHKQNTTSKEQIDYLENNY